MDACLLSIHSLLRLIVCLCAGSYNGYFQQKNMSDGNGDVNRPSFSFRPKAKPVSAGTKMDFVVSLNLKSRLSVIFFFRRLLPCRRTFSSK